MRLILSPRKNRRWKVLSIETGLASDLYRVLILLHIIVAILGFGGVLWNGVYAFHSMKRPGPQGRAISEANFSVSALAEYLIYAVPVTGVLAMWAADGAWAFEDLWIWLSLALYAVSLGVSHSVLIPGHRKINQLLLEMESAPPGTGGPPPQVAQVQALGKRQGAASGVLDLMLVAVLVLMIWKPT